MLWSLIKITAFILIVTALTYGAMLLYDVDGGALVSIAGSEFRLTPLELVFGLAALVAAVWIGLKLLTFLVAVFHFLNGDETAISRYFDRNRERKGYQALADGMLALASGEGHLAMAKAARAEKYLRKPKLTYLLTAQAAEMTGDRRKAEQIYKKLLADDSTRFVGVRGIMKQKLADGDTDLALKLAQKAFALKPDHAETQDILLRLQAEKADWKGARNTLGAKLKTGTLPRDVYRRRDAVLALSEARGILDEGQTIEAREAAIEANRLSPDLIPAAIMAARGYIEQGSPRYATRVLTKTWAVHPHPDLATVFAEIVPDEAPEARLKRFAALTKTTMDHPESQMLMAELHIAAEDFPAAKRDIAGLVEKDPTMRSMTLMAAIERGAGSDDSVVRGWLTRALTAPRDPQWICDNCQHIHSHWGPTCQNCGSFDTLSWKRPPSSPTPMPAGTEMLPLIVAGPHDAIASPDLPKDDAADIDILPDDGQK
jgi:HemY protein